MSIDNSLAFLSTPYEAHPGGLGAAYRSAVTLTADLIEAQPIAVFAPAIYCHPIAMADGPDPRDRKFWMTFIRPFMIRCNFQIVARIPGWDKSAGIAEETGYFESAGKAVFDLDPVTLSLVNRARLKPTRDRYDMASISYEDLEAQKRNYLGHAAR